MSETQDLFLNKKTYSVLGQRPIRHDGADKVTGKAIYTADLALPNMAHAKIVRSPHPHARIKKIDASAALKLPGVLAVVTHDDFPELAAKFALMGEAGATRLCPLGRAQTPAPGWRHDGRPRLADLVRWVDWESGGQ